MNSPSKQQYRLPSERAGTTLTEILVCCVLIAGLVAVAVPMTVRIARQRLVHREILIAQQELRNQMERLSLADAGELSSTTMDVSDAHKAILHDSELQLEVASTDEMMKRVELRLSWTSRRGHRIAPQSLTMWLPPAESADEDPEADE